MYDSDIRLAKIEVTARVIDNIYNSLKEDKNSLDVIINENLFYERKRLKEERDNKRIIEDKKFWKDVNKRLNVGNEKEFEFILEEIVKRYVSEITGHFSVPVYKFATMVLPRALSLMLNPLSIKKFIEEFPNIPSLENNLHISGEVETFKRLGENATIILTPTHISNLDSPLIGLVIYMLGFNPFLYGAGLNLFENPVFSYFMHNLGAYTVDRKKKNSIYKATLKEYSIFALERNYHSLFFPGGTRARSGAVENKLKKGLLGTGIKAYINNLVNNKEKKDIFIFPLNLSYQLVLEAETLIDDFLKESGQSRYIIDDDESSKLEKMALFTSKLISLDSQIHFRIGKPIDVFGNYVNEEGVSIDNRGRTINRSDYITENGKIVFDDQRDAVYTQKLANTIEKEFHRNNIILANNIVSFATFEMFKMLHPTLDIYKLVRIGNTFRGIPIKKLSEFIDSIMTKLRNLHNDKKIYLPPEVIDLNTLDIINIALKFGSIYHKYDYLYRRGDKIYSEDLSLLFYYHNKLTGYGLEK